MTATFYKTVYQRKFDELPRWKRLAIVEDSERNHWSGILTDFIKSVIEEAEKEYANSKTCTEIPPLEPTPETSVKDKKITKKKS